jgi:hypothetical protein
MHVARLFIGCMVLLAATCGSNTPPAASSAPPVATAKVVDAARLVAANQDVNN